MDVHGREQDITYVPPLQMSVAAVLHHHQPLFVLAPSAPGPGRDPGRGGEGEAEIEGHPAQGNERSGGQAGILDVGIVVPSLNQLLLLPQRQPLGFREDRGHGEHPSGFGAKVDDGHLKMPRLVLVGPEMLQVAVAPGILRCVVEQGETSTHPQQDRPVSAEFSGLPAHVAHRLGELIGCCVIRLHLEKHPPLAAGCGSQLLELEEGGSYQEPAEALRTFAHGSYSLCPVEGEGALATTAKKSATHKSRPLWANLAQSQFRARIGINFAPGRD